MYERYERYEMYEIGEIKENTIINNVLLL